MSGWREAAERFSDIDKAALNAILLAEGTCPRCRRELRQQSDGVQVCRDCEKAYAPDNYTGGEE